MVFKPSLAKKTVLFIGNHLSGQNHNKSINDELSEHLDQIGWNTILSSRKTNRFLRLIDMLTTIIKKRKQYSIVVIDLFSGAAFFWGFLCTFLAKIIQKKIIIDLHGGNLPSYSEKHQGFVSFLFNSSDILVSPSPFLKESLNSFQKQIKVIPNGIDLAKYSFRKRDNIQPRAIWLRAFHEIYNPLMAVKVLKVLREKNINFTLSMVGPDKGDGSFGRAQKLARDLEVEDYIEFIPGISKNLVPEYLNRADIFLNTTNFDNTPVSVIEAMACGLCIVTTGVGGIPYLVQDGVDALLVPKDDVLSMTKQVERILIETNLAGNLSEKARKNAESFDWEFITGKWNALFESMR
jgi:glycosyltransferase involved in cell wall biosynthesis